MGPAIDVLASDNWVEKIREYDGTSFAWGANGDNEELNKNLSELESLGLPLSAFCDAKRGQSPIDLIYVYIYGGVSPMSGNMDMSEVPALLEDFGLGSNTFTKPRKSTSSLSHGLT